MSELDVTLRNNESSLNASSSPPEYTGRTALPAPVTITFAVIVSIGFLGNAFIIIIVLSVKQLRNAQNIFVSNLCVADLLLAINAIFSVVEDLVPYWKLQTGTCRLFGFMSFAPPFAAVLSMVVIARNRYRVITGNTLVSLPGKFSVKRVLLWLLVIWGMTLLITMPILFGWVTAKSGLFCACCFYFSDNLPYGISVTVAVYIVPNIVIAYCYIRIIYHVKKSKERVAPVRRMFDSSANFKAIVVGTKRAHDIRLTVQFIILFLVFNVCYTPSMIVFWIDSDENLFSIAAHATVKAIFMLNIVANPLIYFVFNKSALEVVRRVICRKSAAPQPDCCLEAYDSNASSTNRLSVNSSPSFVFR